MFESISQKFSGIMRSLSGKSKISEKNVRDAVEEIKLALLDADVNLRVVRRFVNGTLDEALGEKVLSAVDPGQQFVKIVYDRMVALLGDPEGQKLSLRGPDVVTVILMMGLQGSGKTTTSAKLALRLKKEGRRPLLAAADLVRPAAIDQLQVLGSKVDVPVHVLPGASDPVKVAVDALARAKREQRDVLIIDTAGRMHLDDTLMTEIKKVRDAVKPDETLFVADAMTGQNAVSIAEEFEKRIGISGVILSKFDSDARGGAALSLRSVVGKPIKFIGVGEKPEDFEPFYPERMASRILGMGDIVSLVEKAQETMDIEEAEKMQRKMAKNTFDLQDYLEQLDRMTKMGGVGKMLEMIPGTQGQISEDDIDKAELKREKAIIQSMTYTERENCHIIGPTRRKRIARGSGSSVNDVNRLLRKFEKMRLTMKKFAKNKKYQAEMLKQMGI
ncbi:signal recognition particle protein [Parasphaerochaeta coccoides]|uniref:Signal recognition particle protein n=1 Tax=Parasphaerochaeta coccoides (strain ATCC BAA-1237 / DSM 17374 / SPN1) TaxID=760011 RepID=F4GJ97_PARC1|nr:signal recognition particle protein [Parasphaerochaeta coccoides]AEC01737.1 signal recognition particle subunit FFH/SRP54 (srp54) [Parasphaerochaeta coccoides DSM 17374]